MYANQRFGVCKLSKRVKNFQYCILHALRVYDLLWEVRWPTACYLIHQILRFTRQITQRNLLQDIFLYSVAIQSIIKARNRIEMRCSLKNKKKRDLPNK